MPFPQAEKLLSMRVCHIRRTLFFYLSLRQITFAFPWCCCRWLLAACPVPPRAGRSKRTCFPCCCPCPCTLYNCFCPVFSWKFNIITALSAHQSHTLPQIIDSREGLFWCKKGVVVNAGKMNIYFRKPPFAPIFGLFAAKCGAFWC